ncbi:hypothetical protein NliqN6_0172 [Naganishia liquefaciens]|uniref:Right handed beta helix domain-containing protein n=1 Tax=Naganishia liquefaciens TaxID=104408 RepID=A0A8H3YC04_9TREE|nr:hypothetical protein NliqN6_0172 [Naganishia liquefaciens]
MRLAFVLIFPLVRALEILGTQETADCVPSGKATERIINERFRAGGQGTVVKLCAGSVHRMQEPVVMTAKGQVLETEGGGGEGWGRALLVVEGEEQSMAVKADCTACTNISIRSLVIDGNRPLLLRVPKGEALVEMGNADGQEIRDCRLIEPRGWSALHFREGDWKSCSGGVIRNNVIGPAGEEWDEEYDGSEDPEPRFGNPRADGISLACKDSLVEGNTVFDTTDGAIVLFGSAGSEVRENKVYARTRMVMGAINLVDYDPWEGNYTDVRVHHNTIAGLGSYIKGAINIGQACWTDNTEIMVHGGSVTHNTIEGEGIGYGITVAGARGVTVLDNKSTARYSGVMGRECPVAPPNAEPVAFLINRGSSEGVFQDEFVNGEVQHVICIEPATEDEQPYKPWRLRDSPLAIATLAEEAQSEKTGGYMDEAMHAALADSLVAYQMDVLAALKGVREKLKGSVEPAGKKRTSGKSSVSTALADLFARLANLESEKKQVRQSIDAAKRGMSAYNSRLGNYAKDRTKSFRRLFIAVRTYSTATLPKGALSLMPRHVTQHNWTPALLFLLLELVGLGIWRWSRRGSTIQSGENGHARTSSLGFSTSKPATVGLFGRRKAVRMV